VLLRLEVAGTFKGARHKFQNGLREFYRHESFTNLTKGDDMNYIKLPWLDHEVSVHAVCQAHLQLESDYNEGGILRERPSNQRRNASTNWQLSRMLYSNPSVWVDICTDERGDDFDDDVRDIYLLNVLKWGLPITGEMRSLIAARYVNDWLDATFPDWENTMIFKNIQVGRNFIDVEFGSVWCKRDDTTATCEDPEDTAYDLGEPAGFGPRESVKSATVFSEHLPEGNADRAQRAAVALRAHQRYTSSESPPRPADLLADLMHYCVKEGLDFQRESQVALEFFGDEA
jgi:hypothetical protein